MTFNPKTRELIHPLRRKVLSPIEVIESMAAGVVCGCHSKSCQSCVVRDTLVRDRKVGQ